MRLGALGALASLVALMVACTPSSSQEGTKVAPPASTSATPPASTSAAVVATSPPPRPTGGGTPTVADGPDSCRIHSPCPPRVVTMAGGTSTSIPQECCLQPGGADGSQDHLACQDQHSKRPCVLGCVTDADCPNSMKCRPWGKDHRNACAAP